MLSIFNRMFRNATGTQDWRPPLYWEQHLHQSTYHRQASAAEAHRRRLARDIGMD